MPMEGSFPRQMFKFGRGGEGKEVYMLKCLKKGGHCKGFVFFLDIHYKSMEKQDRHIDVLERFMQGATTIEEEQELLTWLREPSSAGVLAIYYQQKWEVSQQKELEAEVQCRMFLHIKEQMGYEEHPKAKRISFRSFRGTWRYVAAMLVGLLAGLTVYWAAFPQQTREEDFIVSAERGQRANITLPDGTRVWLNSHTELRYGTEYGHKERLVELDGEAYFEVAKDKNRRFVVRAGDLEVEALGTSFDVKAYKEEKTRVATLLEGKVRTRIAGQGAILKPDQQAVYNKEEGSLQITRPDNAAYACMWRDGELAFSGETLEEIAVMFKRLYNVEVRFEAEDIKSYRFSGVIKNNSLENVIELISLTAPITYRTEGDTIILSARK